jgi:predicted nucleic-acid-binding Zn-ribbon protein
MKASSKCPKCGSTDIIANAKVNLSGMRELTVTSYAKPDAMVFKDETSSAVSAWVCRQCGYVEFYANHPRVLRGPEA